ncbi:MAG: hypothetical protein KF775_06495 [Cyclobacteriaceae bacterium]|nr:hypothetical protein [Cyclobacteriaceae bacterium]
MFKIAFCWVAILCLLILVSAPTLTASIKKTYPTATLANLADDTEEKPAPTPNEEDCSEDHLSFKSVPWIKSSELNHVATVHSQYRTLLFGTNFLEIVSPPPKA